MENHQEEMLVEAVLFLENNWVSYERLRDILSCEKPELEETLRELGEKYHRQRSCFFLQKREGEVLLSLKPEIALALKGFYAHPVKIKLRKPVMETLAIVAYRQPVTKPGIEKIRGVDASHSLRELQNLDLIDIEGEADGPGKPHLYVTTKNFLERFGLQDLRDLPSLEEVGARVFSPEGEE